MLVETMLAELQEGESVAFRIEPESRSVRLSILKEGAGVRRAIATEVLNTAAYDVVAETFREALDELRKATS